MSDDSDINLSDGDFDDSKHGEIVEKVLSLNKNQSLKKSSRTEPSYQISEYNLVKSITGKKGSIQIEDLTKSLKSKKKHADTGRKVEATKKKTQTLPKPLEKPLAARIKRTVSYEKNRFLFDRWEAFVASNRSSTHQVFPLDSVENLKTERKKAAGYFQSLTCKSKLQKELEKLDKVEEFRMDAENNDDNGDNNNQKEVKLTLKELNENRKEAAKLRAHQNFQEAKARRQNKIKSKKYHRLLRKEKIRNQFKEFEALQKTDPEEALKKLEEIEKIRALERFSLRHKGTGQWAKNKQIRAKYDKESRQMLAEQLRISRDLTKKKKIESDSEEDEAYQSEEIDKIVTTTNNTENNPWTTNGPKPSKEITDFLVELKKIRAEQNNQEEPKEEIEEDAELEKLAVDDDCEEKESEVTVNKSNDNVVIKEISSKKKKRKLETKSLGKKKKQKTLIIDVEESLNEADTKLQSKIKKKVIKENIEKVKKVKKGNKNKEKLVTKKSKKTQKKIDLTIPNNKNKKQIIDEEMIENTGDDAEAENNVSINVLKNILSKEPEEKKNKNETKKLKTNQKVTDLVSIQPDLVIGEEDDDEDQRNIMIEAFEDGEIAKDFIKEKKSEIAKDKPENIDLNLPGWGAWAGAGIINSKKKQKKRRRFIVRMPEVLPRRDDNKGALIINENVSTGKMRPHLVAQVPYPFKSVKDYEASLRAPISNSFVPELAYRRFIKPTVETRMGSIIEPANLSHLIAKPK